MNCPDSYNDDQQGFYYDEARKILQGKLDKPLTDDHQQALMAEQRLRLPEVGEREQLEKWGIK